MDWEEDERKGNDLVTNKKIIPNHGNIAGRLPKGLLWREFSFQTVENLSQKQVVWTVSQENTAESSIIKRRIKRRLVQLAGSSIRRSMFN